MQRDSKTGNLQVMVLIVKSTVELDVQQNTIKKTQHWKLELGTKKKKKF